MSPVIFKTNAFGSAARPFYLGGNLTEDNVLGAWNFREGDEDATKALTNVNAYGSYTLSGINSGGVSPTSLTAAGFRYATGGDAIINDDAGSWDNATPGLSHPDWTASKSVSSAIIRFENVDRSTRNGTAPLCNIGRQYLFVRQAINGINGSSIQWTRNENIGCGSTTARARHFFYDGNGGNAAVVACNFGNSTSTVKLWVNGAPADVYQGGDVQVGSGGFNAEDYESKAAAKLYAYQSDARVFGGFTCRAVAGCTIICGAFYNRALTDEEAEQISEKMGAL